MCDLVPQCVCVFMALCNKNAMCPQTALSGHLMKAGPVLLRFPAARTYQQHGKQTCWRFARPGSFLATAAPNCNPASKQAHSEREMSAL